MSINRRGWQGIMERIEATEKHIPDIKRQVFEEVGQTILRQVRSNINTTGIHDPAGRVKSAQNYSVGNYGGYVAIRPQPVPHPTHKTDFKKITGWLEHGHGAREPSGLSRRESRVRCNDRTGLYYVRGYQFYSWVTTDREALHAADRMLNLIADEFDDLY